MNTKTTVSCYKATVILYEYVFGEGSAVLLLHRGDVFTSSSDLDVFWRVEGQLFITLSLG